jgi:hypothetical protein
VTYAVRQNPKTGRQYMVVPEEADMYTLDGTPYALYPDVLSWSVVLEVTHLYAWQAQVREEREHD